MADVAKQPLWFERSGWGLGAGMYGGVVLLLICDFVSSQGEDEAVILKSCTRRKTDSIEKRFCFDVEAVDR